MDRGPIPLSRSKRKCLTLVVGLFLFGKAEAERTPSGSTRPVEMPSMFYWGSP